MRAYHFLSSVLVVLVLLVGGLNVSGQPRPGSSEEFATVEMRRIEKLAADPKADPDKLWQELVDFRRCYPAQPQAIRAAELMSKVRSPLDTLDRKQIPEEDRLAWLPTEVVAVLGEHRGGHWGPVWDVASSADGKVIVSSAIDGARVWDGDTLAERAYFPKAKIAVAPDGKTIAVVEQRTGSVRLLDLRTTPLKECGLIQEHAKPLLDLTFTHDGKELRVRPSLDVLSACPILPGIIPAVQERACRCPPR